MEKPLSPKPEVEERLNRVTCATCSGKGVLDPGVTAFSLPIDDSSITFAPDAVPPTLGSISVASPLFGKAAEGDVVLRVAFRIRGDVLAESDGPMPCRNGGAPPIEHRDAA